MFSLWSLPVLAITTIYQAIACCQENQHPPPGQMIDVGDHRLHLLHLTSLDPAIAARPTVIIDHSLGGVEGYLLIHQIEPLAEVCLCDHAGYGWSDLSRQTPNSEQAVRSLDIALTNANVQPPYILVGNSLGSHHMRLYAHRFPEKVVGMVLTDGLHERAMLKMPLPLRLLQLLFWSGFILSIFGSAMGLIRVAAKVGLFGLIKPPLRQIPAVTLRPVLRSFCRPKHWLTMAREIAQLDTSGQQLQEANEFGHLPVVNIKAQHFFKHTWLSRWLPLASIAQLRSEMQADLMGLSTDCIQLSASHSSHFVWIDQPEVIVHAVRHLLCSGTQPLSC